MKENQGTQSFVGPALVILGLTILGAWLARDYLYIPILIGMAVGVFYSLRVVAPINTAQGIGGFFFSFVGGMLLLLMAFNLMSQPIELTEAQEALAAIQNSQTDTEARLQKATESRDSQMIWRSVENWLYGLGLFSFAIAFVLAMNKDSAAVSVVFQWISIGLYTASILAWFLSFAFEMEMDQALRGEDAFMSGLVLRGIFTLAFTIGEIYVAIRRKKEAKKQKNN